MTDPKQLFFETEYQREFKWKKPFPVNLVVSRYKTSEVQTEDRELLSHVQNIDSKQNESREQGISENNESKEKEREKTESLVFIQPEKVVVTGKTPVILPYGGANVQPCVSSNFMKSFNTRVPQSEQYSHIKEKNQKMTSYDTKRKQKDADRKAGHLILDDTQVLRADSALKQYIRAKELIGQIQARFTTEYQRQYLDWNKPVEIDGELRQIVPDVENPEEYIKIKSTATNTNEPVFVEKEGLKPTVTKTQEIKSKEPKKSIDKSSNRQLLIKTGETKTSTESIQTEPFKSSIETQTHKDNIETINQDREDLGSQTQLQTQESQTFSPISETPIEVKPKVIVINPIQTITELETAGKPKNRSGHDEKRHFPSVKDSIQIQIEELQQQLNKSLEAAVSKLTQETNHHTNLLKYTVMSQQAPISGQELLEKAKKRQRY